MSNRKVKADTSGKFVIESVNDCLVTKPSDDTIRFSKGSIVLKAVDAEPANPWITDRLPTEADAVAGRVWIWSESLGMPSWCWWHEIKEGCPWRPIDVTPPPPLPLPEPTIEDKKAALLEVLFSHLEDGGENNWFVERKIQEFRILQESEGRDVER